jgi:baculoviral IAP repeat-containing protein 2/3
MVTSYEHLKSEQARLDTFYGQPPPWPVPFIDPKDCAKAGFFFLRDGDKVQCSFCRGVAGEWEPGDVPLAEHKRHFPRCPFICNLPVGNIPIGHEHEAAARLHEDQQSSPFGIDVCGPFEPSIRPYAGPDQVHVRGAQPLNGEMDDVATSLAIKTGSGPARKNLVTLQSRLKSFTSWPGTTGQTPEKMAEAGFYYIGVRDHVKCFYCDGGLRNWEECDDPWDEHARWFSACPYVVLNKGQEFIKKASESKPPVIPSSSFKNSSGGNSSRTAQPRRVTDEELRQLIDTPIVQAALEMGMEVGKVKGALQRKLQQTGTPFLTTEALLEAVLGRDPEYESDSDSSEDGNDEDEDLAPARNTASNINTSAAATLLARYAQSSSAAQETNSMDVSPPAVASLTPSTSVESSSSGDEDVVGLKPTTCRSLSGDSGTCSAGNSSGEEEHNESEVKKQQQPMQMRDVTKALELKEEEIRKLREARQCKICMDNEVGVVFLPCGHLVSCVSCATALSNCALCRQPIKAVVRTYLS